MEVAWYVRSDGRETIGPLTTELLATSIRMGRVPLNAAACAAGSDQWLPVLELAPFADAAREIIPPRPAPMPAARDTDSVAESDTVPSQIVFRREQDRTSQLPLTYREYVHLVAKGTSTSDATILLRAQLKLVQASLEHLPPGKLVNLAVFDNAFQAKPLGAPLATLKWKDWPDRDDAMATPAVSGAAGVASEGASPLPEGPASAAGARNSNAPPAPVSEAASGPLPPESGASALVEEAAPLSLVTRAGTRHSSDAHGSLDGRGRDDDLIGDLFDTMHELHFLPDAIEAGDFCLRICLEKLGCEAGVVHVYQSDQREFVVTNTRGTSANRLLLRRYSISDPPLASVMSQRRPVMLQAVADEQDSAENERCVPKGGMRRVLLAPVMPAGRFLGAIELFNTVDGQPFSQGEANALAYIAQHLADFISTHGVVTSHDRIRQRHDRLASTRAQRSSAARA